jgi:hypothetical protein
LSFLEKEEGAFWRGAERGVTLLGELRGPFWRWERPLFETCGSLLKGCGLWVLFGVEERGFWKRGTGCALGDGVFYGEERTLFGGGEGVFFGLKRGRRPDRNCVDLCPSCNMHVCL